MISEFRICRSARDHSSFLILPYCRPPANFHKRLAFSFFLLYNNYVSFDAIRILKGRTRFMQKKLKSILCLLLCVLMAASLPVTAIANAIGDVDGNGKVETSDARLALRAAIGLEHYEAGSAKFKAADVDFNGKIGTDDARRILRASINLETLKEADHEHTWVVTKQKNTKGTHTYVCSECKETKTEKCVYGTERFPLNSKAVVYPTCTKEANFYLVCTVCDGKHPEPSEPALNHPNKKRVAALSVEATCTTAGYDFYECPLCGENGNTLKDLKVEVPAYGHAPSSAADPINHDIVCERCKKTITPAFNTLVNAINQSATPRIFFAGVEKAESAGELKKDAKGNEMYHIEIPAAAKWLMKQAGESIDEETILAQFTDELNKKEATYTNYWWNDQFLTDDYPIQNSDKVSNLTKEDVTGINIQEISAIDFMDEIETIKDEEGKDTNKIKVQLSDSGYYRLVDLTDFRALGYGMTGNIYKITVTLKQETYSKIKNSTKETALQHATGIDIRTYPELFTQNDSEDGFDLEMKCNDVTSNCTISYYFLVEGEGTEATYKPLASKYITRYDIDQHIYLRAGMPISELGIDSGLVNLLLATFGLKQGDDIVFMEGTIDMIVSNTNTDYYLFHNAS